jgi:CRP-like cAMP-binding protein
MLDLLALTADLPTRAVSAGETLLVEGGRSGSLIILVAGEVEVCRGDVTLAVVDEPGACLGEISVLLDRPHGATVIARTDVVVREAPDAMELLTSDPRIGIAVAAVLAHRIDVLNAYLSDVLHQYGGAGGHLSLLHDVLADLATARPQAIETGSAREPDPLY